MKIAVSGKTLDTRPVKNILMQGEALADEIDITLPREYNGLDLTALEYSIKAVSEKDTMAIQALTKRVGTDNITLIWSVTEDFTAIPGVITLTILGTDGDGLTRIKFRGDDISVRADISDAGGATPDAIEQLLAQCISIVATAQAAAAGSATEAAQSATEAAASAGEADQSKTAAAGSATAAAQSAAGAADSQQAAAGSATEAAQSAMEAAASAEAAQYAEEETKAYVDAHTVFSTVRVSSESLLFSAANIDGETLIL